MSRNGYKRCKRRVNMDYYKVGEIMYVFVNPHLFHHKNSIYQNLHRLIPWKLYRPIDKVYQVCQKVQVRQLRRVFPF